MSAGWLRLCRNNPFFLSKAAHCGREDTIFSFLRIIWFVETLINYILSGWTFTLWRKAFIWCLHSQTVLKCSKKKKLGILFALTGEKCRKINMSELNLSPWINLSEMGKDGIEGSCCFSLQVADVERRRAHRTKLLDANKNLSFISCRLFL